MADTGPGAAWTSRTGLLAAAALLALSILALQVAGFHELRYDDAFITYRYGENLATGQGLVFNPGERIMGSTSPLHSLLSGLVYSLVGKARLPSAMAAVGCAGWLAQAAAVFFLFRAALGALPAFLVALALAAGAAGSSEWAAMETNLVAAFALWAVVAATASRWVAAALLLALAGLTRPDAYLLGLPLCLLAVADLRAGRVANWWRPVVAFVLPTAPWLLFAWSYYGTVIPQSAVTKVSRTAPGRYFHHLLSEPAEILLGGRQAPGWIAVAWLLAAAGTAFLVARQRRLWVLPAWGVLHFAAYWALRPFAAHRWHVYPLVLVVVVSALGAVAGLSRLEPRRLTRRLAVVGLGALVALYAARSLWWASTHPDEWGFGSRHRAYQRVAEFLVDHGCREGGLIAAVEVGTIGYYSGCRMYDLGGLISRLPREPGRWSRPDWFVLDPLYLSLVPNERPVEMFWDGDFRAYLFAVSPRSRRSLGLPDAGP